MRQALIFKSSWGWIGISESAKGVDGIALPKQSKRAIEKTLRDQSREPFQAASSPRLEAARCQLLDYLAGKRNIFDMPLDLSQGTSFQRRVCGPCSWSHS